MKPPTTEQQRTDTFLKQVTVQEGGTLEFRHQGKTYRVGGEFLKKLVGRDVLIDAGLEVFRGDKRLGIATPA